MSSNFWRYLANFWAIVLHALIIADFLFKNGLEHFMRPVCSIYIAALAVYSARKEFERWHDYHVGRHPGEVYVITWTILMVIMFTLQLIYHETYEVSEIVWSTYIVVIGILAITKKSKLEFLSRKRRKS